MSVYEQLGRETGIRTAVDDFYRRVLADPQLTGYFDGIDLNRLRAHQAKLLVQVTGGPASYDGRELTEAHRGLDITPAAFERVAGHLAATLTDLGVPPSVVGDVVTAVDGYRDQVVGAGAGRA